MSESDDTDILLLIPPDFFTIHHSDSECSFIEDCCVEEDVVNDLILQVCSLNSRLSIIESKESLSTPFPEHSYCTEDRMAQPNWNDINSSTPKSRSLRATSLPPTPSTSAPVYYRTNSYPSPSKSVPISPDRNSFYGKSAFSRRGPLSPSTHSANEEIPSDLKVRNYVSQLSNHKDTKPATRAKNAETMKEIDAFFENLRGRYGNRSRGVLTNVSYPGTSPVSTQVHQLGLAEVDRLLEKVEADQMEMEAKLSARERQFGLPVGEEVATAKHIKSFPGDSISSVPDLNLGVRKLWDDKPKQSPMPLSSSTRTTNGYDHSDGIIEEPFVQKKYSLIGKGASDQNSPHTNGQEKGSQGPKVFQSRRRLDLDNSSKPDIERLPDEGKTAPEEAADYYGSTVLHGGPMGSFSRHENYSIPPEVPPAKNSKSVFRGDQHPSKASSKGSQNNMGVPASVIAGAPSIPPLMSLADLWGEKSSSQSLTLEQRLEEEKCRREHCEALVQTLQSRLLEAQQRLAVAQRVDSEKDSAIQHLHSTWSRIMEAWNTLEEERDSVANELEAVRSSLLSEKEHLAVKLAKCQDELSKAVNLAHGYKEQSQVAERTRTEQLEILGDKVKEVERRLETATQMNNETQTRNSQLQELLTKECEKSAELQKTLFSVKETLTQREADVCILTEEKKSLQTRLKEERARGDTLQQSRDTIRKEAEDAGKRERALQAEIRQLNQQLSTIRSELRDFYQDQLERAVRDKLTEFQSQLDAAEGALHREAENRELAMAELAARQLKQLNTKHKQEVALLEQRHSEQLHLAHLQANEAEKTILQLRKQLEEHEANASNLAQRLHGIMQNQWREALSVVSGPKVGKGESKASSVSSKGDFARDGESASGQAWLLVKQEQENRRRQRQIKQEEQSPNFETLPGRKSPSKQEKETPFEQEGLLTQRSTSVANVPHRTSSSSGDSSEDLKKYIKMLLDRAPGRPFESSLPLETGVHSEKLNEKVASTGRDSRNSGGKPPWK